MKTPRDLNSCNPIAMQQRNRMARNSPWRVIDTNVVKQTEYRQYRSFQRLRNPRTANCASSLLRFYELTCKSLASKAPLRNFLQRSRVGNLGIITGAATRNHNVKTAISAWVSPAFRLVKRIQVQSPEQSDSELDKEHRARSFSEPSLDDQSLNLVTPISTRLAP